MREQDTKLAESLMQLGLLTRAQLEAVGDRPLVDFLLRFGLITPEQLQRARSLFDQPVLDFPHKPTPATSYPDDVRLAAAKPKNDIGKHILIHLLGRGGTGEVWKAWEKDLQRYVAIKFLAHGTAEYRQRLLREALVVAKLEHPNIVPVYDVGESERGIYIAMKFVQGETLEEASLTLNQKVMAIRDAAIALEHAHQRGIIHRDVKPQNILVESAPLRTPTPATPTSQRPKKDDPVKVYVMDFGLAKQESIETSVSTTGVVAGTPEYMPPEQARGSSKEIDARSDVYSLGATLYRLVTGVTPFRGDHPLEVLEKVLHDDPPPPSRFYPKLPRDVQTIILKCLEKTKARRYPSARELADDIQRYLDGETVHARPASLVYRVRKFTMRHRALTGSLALAALLVAIVLFVLLWPARAHVTSEPDGASIRVDGRDTGLVTPADVTLWPPGKHVIEVSKPGYDPSPIDVQVAAAQSSRASAHLTKNFGYLTVVSAPADATVTLESGGQTRLSLQTPALDAPVPRGVYRVVIGKEGYAPVVDAVDIRSDARTKIEKALAPQTGHLSASGNVDGMMMTLDAVDRSDVAERTLPLPVEELPLPVGRYRLVFEAPGYFTRISQVAVLAGSLTTARASLNSLLLWSRQVGQELVGVPLLADLNLDGYLDCIVASPWGTLTALSGRDGATLWETRVPGLWGIRMRTIRDLNGDGVLDPIVLSVTGNIFALSGTDGSVLWKSEEDSISEIAPEPADLNGDGCPDIVAATFKGEILAYSGRNGKVLWRFSAGSTLAGVPVVVDSKVIFSTVGRIVFALSGKDGSVLWRRQFEEDVRGDPGIADLNGDKIPDVVLHNDSRILAISGLDGSTLREYPMDAHSVRASAMADVDGDGVADLFIFSGDLELRAVSGKSGAVLWTWTGPEPLSTELVLADLDRDGVPDAIISTQSGTVMVISGKSGTLISKLKVGGTKIGVAVGDVDGDGRLELAAVSTTGNVMVFTGRNESMLWEFKTGAWSRVTACPAAADQVQNYLVSTPSDIFLVSGTDGTSMRRIKKDSVGFWDEALDLDGDGTLDIISSSTKGVVRAWSGKDGRMLWETQVEGTPNQSPEGQADLDGDGIPDVIFSTTQKLYALSGKSGKVLWQTDIALGSQLSNLKDMNGDRIPDLVVTAAAEDKIRALSGKDGSVLWTSSGGKSVWSRATLVDLNGDGLADCFIGSSNRHVSALSGKDGSLLWDVARASMITDVCSPGDLNGDRVPDLFVVDASGLTALSGKDGSSLWEVSGYDGTVTLASADVDGDGIQDAVVVNLARTNGATSSSLYVFSGRDGSVLQHLVAPGFSSLTVGRSPVAGKFVATCRIEGYTVRSFLLTPSGAPLVTHERLPEATLRRALLRYPDGRLVPQYCAEAAALAHDKADRHQLLILQAAYLIRQKKLEEAQKTLLELKKDLCDSYPLFTYLFICRPMTESLVEALERDPERTCELLLAHQELWGGRGDPPGSAASLISGRARAAALLLNRDYDLALSELNSLRITTDPQKIARLERMFPATADPYYDRSLQIGTDPSRIAALSEMGLARDGGNHTLDLIELAAAAHISLGNRARAMELIRKALQTPGLPEDHHKRLQGLLERCGHL